MSRARGLEVEHVRWDGGALLPSKRLGVGEVEEYITLIWFSSSYFLSGIFPLRFTFPPRAP